MKDGLKYDPKTEIGNSNHLVQYIGIHVLPSETICREYDIVAVNYTGTDVGELYYCKSQSQLEFPQSDPPYP